MQGDASCKVVINDEEQYSIWQADRDNAPGWYDEGFSGSRQECLDYIDETWMDICPRSVRVGLSPEKRIR
jgi:MbtH protein